MNKFWCRRPTLAISAFASLALSPAEMPAPSGASSLDWTSAWGAVGVRSAQAQCNAVWEQAGPASPRRAFFAAAFDQARGKVVLYGGQADVPDGNAPDTWTWDGTNWEQVATTGPSPRNSLAMVYDSAREKCVLFGGTAHNVLNADTWEWDGTSWSLAAFSGPPARSMHCLAYDSVRHKVVLFGGVQQNGEIPGETWEYDGATWTQVAATGPVGRFLANMTFDAARGRTVLYGGQRFGFDTELNDTWTWDGTQWRQETPETSPPKRSMSSMCYDPATQDVVMFGGYRSNGGWIEDNLVWRWNGTNWRVESSNNIPGRIGHWIGHDSARNALVMVAGNTPIFATDPEPFLRLQRTGPEILAHPQPAEACRIATVGFSVMSNGGYAFQWRRNGQPISDTGPFIGSGSPNLTISGLVAPITNAFAGSYDCIVSNSCGTVTSDTATLTVNSCVADIANSDGFPYSCDGAVTIDDLLFYLDAFELGLQVADVDDGSSTGVPDSAVTIDDLLYYLLRFEAGC